MINDSTDKTELTWTRSLAIDQTRLQRKLDDLLRLTGCWLLKAGHLCWIVRSARAVRDLVEYSDSLIQLSKSGSRTLLFTTLAHSNGIWRESGRRCGPALQWQGDSVQAPRWATRYAERCFGPWWLRGGRGREREGGWDTSHRVVSRLYRHRSMWASAWFSVANQDDSTIITVCSFTRYFASSTYTTLLKILCQCQCRARFFVLSQARL